MSSLRSRSKYVAPSKPALNGGLTLFHCALAPGSLWVRLILAEKDVEGSRASLQVPGRSTPELLAANPSLVLPTLVDRDTVVYPSRVIAEYLEERYPHPPMMPPEPAHRARLRMTLDRLEQDFFPLIAAIDGGGAAGQKARALLVERVTTSARLFPARGWFLGLDYSIVDCAWIALFWRLAQLKLDLPPAADPVRRYCQRAFARPAFQASLGAAS